MFPKRLLALTLFAALAVMPTCVLRAQWVRTNGPNGGAVYALAEIGTNLFAGTDGGVFITTDNGTSWASAGSCAWLAGEAIKTPTRLIKAIGRIQFLICRIAVMNLQASGA